MQSALEQLNQTPGVLGSLVVADDGLVIARHVSHGIDADTVAATIGSLALSVDTLSAGCRCGHVRAITLESDGRRLLVVRLAAGVLVAIAEGSASVGLTRMAMKQTIAAIEARLPGAKRHRMDEAPAPALSGVR